jgi:ferrous iron transport protein A
LRYGDIAENADEIKLTYIGRAKMKMSELKSGDRAEVLSIVQGTEVARRLADMGLTMGARFKVIRKAPLGDPMEIKIDRFLLALRLEEAGQIEVKLLEKPARAVKVKQNG